ncbi:glycosyltransferase family 39 protein [Caldilinea sp.]|uniref:glycosyltransferase family 39 protein n=1 Tax=Caldilinea sp. TaxID=2293560 RepID=UPI002C6764AC|nr:glycosyltransferase family 39 protein [Caldilinea sp.]
MLLGFALRLFRLGAESLWYDETVSVYLARQPLTTMLAHTAGDIHPPGYYALLHLWQQATAPTLAHGLEFLYAWPSLAAGLLLLALIYALGCRLFDARTGLITLWLAAANPFQLWYSQEVRMYTVGAALALLCLWTAVRFLDDRQPRRWLAVYAVSAAAGLYTLYYFAFWLVAVNVAILALLWRGETKRRVRIGVWLGAQLGAALLFAPWLPTALRQILQPPVPPWRTAWTTPAALLASLSETMGALVVGQSPPGALAWPWALLVSGVTVAFILWAWRGDGRAYRTSVALVLTVVFLPMAQLYAITLLVTPIYHVRYVFLYAPLFLLAPAALIAAYWGRQRWLAIGFLGLWLAASVAAVVNFWSNPLYRADDHRGAVASLAANWRPSDAILANAGWVYPVLTTYWPTALAGVDSAVLPQIESVVSLVDYAQNMEAETSPIDAPRLTRSGSVDGPSTLGWGDPASDFFTISAADTSKALTAIAKQSPRIWHYRLYDTVSDPQGVIRQWLAEHTALLQETPIPGRDFGRVQLFAAPPLVSDQSPLLDEEICFGELLCLLDYAQTTETAEAGTVFYLSQQWRPAHPLPELAVSLRLYDQGGRLAAQRDAPWLPASDTWAANEVQTQSLALPIGVSTKPGAYSLEMVVYHTDTGEPLSLPATAPSPDGQRLHLGEVTVAPSPRIPELPAPLASFDYIDLLEARFDRTGVQPGEDLHATFFWRPRPNAYHDMYQVVLALQDQSGVQVQEWRFTLGSDEYPSGDWLESQPVRDFYDLMLPATLARGRYTLTATLHRAADDAPIAPRRGWFPQETVVVGEITVSK